MKDSNNCVLFVDDEKNILNALRRGLSREKYLKFFAESGEEALKIMKVEKIDVIVTDMRMPVMDGLELLKIVNDKYPGVVKIVLSGYTQLPQILATINQVDIFKFITKPWDMETEFKKVINDAIDYFNIRMENQILKESLEKKNALYQKLLKENDEKIKIMKKDYVNVINLMDLYNKNFFNQVNEEEMQCEKFIENVEAYRNGLDIINEYFLNLPTNYKDFTLYDIEDVVDSFIKEIEIVGLDEKFFQYKNAKKKVYRGDFFLICNILKLIIKYYILENNRKNVRILVNVEEKMYEDEILFIVTIKNRYFTEYSLLVKNLSFVFFEFSKILGGEIKYSDVKDNNVISIKVNLQKVL